MLRLEPRREPSRAMFYLTPFLAVLLTLIAGAALFAALGKPPLETLRMVFIQPLTSLRSISELLVKGTPLILIAIGLAVGFRGGIWNIGAEGQFTIGALAGGSVALAVYPEAGFWLLPLMAIAGTLGGMAWAAIPALLRTRFNTNEILVSLMLTYVATLLLTSLMHGPLRDPQGYNFPESRIFQVSLPVIIEGTRAHIGFLAALALAALSWVLMQHHMLGYQLRVLGQAPKAARFGGFSEERLVWLSFMISGGCAGLAGLFEAAGPVGQLVPALPVGYGFTAIIVAFLGRLHPGGIVLAGLLMALTYIGGETAQIALSLPSATIGVFQGMFLFFLLGTDALVNYRPRWVPRRVAAPAPPEAAEPVLRAAPAHSAE
jgi:general nucleoside transport system permease protein